MKMPIITGQDSNLPNVKAIIDGDQYSSIFKDTRKLAGVTVGIVAMDDEKKGWCKVTAMEKCEGDVTVQSRKQKKFPLYELEITLKWEGELYDDQVVRIYEASPPAS